VLLAWRLLGLSPRGARGLIEACGKNPASNPPEGALGRGNPHRAPRGGWQDAAVRRFNLHAPAFDHSSERDGYRLRSAHVAQAIGADQIGARLYALEDGQRTHPFHFHHGIEEWLVVVDGSPRVRTPAGEQVLKRGDVLCFPVGSGGGHQVSGPGTVLIVSDRHSPDVVEYPESGKLRVDPPGTVFRSADSVDLWEGE
jgi:uncharacterized cupin superfamily protein